MPDPLTPDKAAEKIVAELLADLPAERQAKLLTAIEDAIHEWGNVCSSCEPTGEV